MAVLITWHFHSSEFGDAARIGPQKHGVVYDVSMEAGPQVRDDNMATRVCSCWSFLVDDNPSGMRGGKTKFSSACVGGTLTIAVIATM